MTPEELLKPRYKVIADYPLSLFTIGEILYYHSNDGGWGNEGCYSNCPKFPNPNHRLFPPGSIEKYPHLFKPLAWYEDREGKDMPKHIRVNQNTVLKVKKHFVEHPRYVGKREWYKATGKGAGTHEPFYPYDICLPATLEEYTQYLNPKP